MACGHEAAHNLTGRFQFMTELAQNYLSQEYNICSVINRHTGNRPSDDFASLKQNTPDHGTWGLTI